MKVLLINGSPHALGCTFTALSVGADELEKAGIETEIVHVGHKDIRAASDATSAVSWDAVSLIKTWLTRWLRSLSRPTD